MLQGEVAINHCIDLKSYNSLHTLVNDMFPPTSIVEQVIEFIPLLLDFCYMCICICFSTAGGLQLMELLENAIV